jgi:hypothetical protein
MDVGNLVSEGATNPSAHLVFQAFASSRPEMGEVAPPEQTKADIAELERQAAKEELKYLIYTEEDYDELDEDEVVVKMKSEMLRRAKLMREFAHYGQAYAVSRMRQVHADVNAVDWVSSVQCTCCGLTALPGCHRAERRPCISQLCKASTKLFVRFWPSTARKPTRSRSLAIRCSTYTQRQTH